MEWIDWNEVMAGFLIAEEGPLAGLVVRFEEGEQWILGRDPDVSYQVLEDPMVSRKHVICRLTDEGYTLENLSAVNPASVNGKEVEESVLLQEGDTIQIGNIFFLFTLKDPTEKEEGGEPSTETTGSPTIYEEGDDLGSLTFGGVGDARWIIKVISGPNSGAEFGLHQDMTFTIGKDPKTCDILFQDLSVSRQHAKITASKEGEVTIEDLGSLNKVLINGQEISGPTKLKTQDLVALGTTSFLVIDQEQTRETIVSPAHGMDYAPPSSEKEEKKGAADAEVAQRNWKKMVIPTRHLFLAAAFAVLLLLGLGGVFSLFKTEPVAHSPIDETHDIAKALKQFPEVEFSYNPATGKIFLLGHVMTEIDQQEMIYLVKSLGFIDSIEDNVIIDELVWENTNALIVKNTAWRGVNLTSIIPGRFVLRGYVQTLEDASKLAEYINLNFPYLDKLDNQVVVENTLEAQIQGLLLEHQFGSVSFQFSNGELILAGRVPSNHEAAYSKMLKSVKKIPGVRTVKNLVIFSSPSDSIVDISSRYKVSGSSKYGNVSQYVVINGKILSVGSDLDEMTIKSIHNNTIFLEKDGIKYKINYNQP